jgi:hypothetical protein
MVTANFMTNPGPIMLAIGKVLRSNERKTNLKEFQ